MKSLEEQIRAYTEFVSEEVAIKQQRPMQKPIQHRVSSGADLFDPVSAPIQTRKAPRSRFALAGAACIAMVCFGLVTLGLKRTDEPTKQVAVFTPKDVASLPHYAPTYIPAGYELETISKTKTPTLEGIDHMIVFGRVEPDKQISSATIIAQGKSEELFTPSATDGTPADRRLISRTRFRVFNADRPFVEGQNQPVQPVWIAQPLNGCGYVSVWSAGVTDPVALAAIASKVSCVDHHIRPMNAPTGTDLLYDAPIKSETEIGYVMRYVAVDKQTVYFTQLPREFPGVLYDVFARVQGLYADSTEQTMGTHTVRVAHDPSGPLSFYTWRDGDVAFSIMTQASSTEETAKMIASITPTSETNWNQLLEKHFKKTPSTSVPPDASAPTSNTPASNTPASNTPTSSVLPQPATVVPTPPTTPTSPPTSSQDLSPAASVPTIPAGVWKWSQPSAAMLPTAAIGSVWEVMSPPTTVERGALVIVVLPESPTPPPGVTQQQKQTTRANMKRVVAIPGDTVRISNNQVVVNDKPIDEPYLAPGEITESSRSDNSITLGPDEYYVLGDNRANSFDSRAFTKSLRVENIVATVVGPTDPSSDLRDFPQR